MPYGWTGVNAEVDLSQGKIEKVKGDAKLVEEYSQTTSARVFYNVFQAFPRAMFSVNWEKLVVTDEEFASLATQIGTGKNIRINFLDHDTLDKLYVMVFPDGSMVIPRGADYLNFGPFLEIKDFQQALNASQFDSDKHLCHSHGWSKGATPMRQVLNVSRVDSLNILNV